MSEIQFTKIQAIGTAAELNVLKGHFATNHGHVNYFLDTTTLKSRIRDAQEIAKSITGMLSYDIVIDTIVCLEGTEVIGAFLGESLKKGGFREMNQYHTICVITPEFNNGQMIFRDNVASMIHGKNILVLTASMTTGISTRKAIDCIAYYGGKLQCITAIFSLTNVIDDIPVYSVFSKHNLPDYMSADFRECPLCKAGVKIDALVNHYGYSAIVQ